MSVAVKLLLFLSALLSALTGAGAGTRAPQQVVAVAQAAQTATVLQCAEPGRWSPVAILLPGLRSVQVVSGARWALASAAPLFLSRRRE